MAENMTGDSEIEDTEDGGAIITFAEQTEQVAQVENFYDNIVDNFDEPSLDTLSTNLLELIDRDIKAREKRVKEYAEGLKRTGLGDEAPGGADFQGASKVVHPVLTEAAVDFAAQAIKELMPPSGPVKEYLPGDEVTQERAAKSRRKVNFMNWQFKVQMRGIRTELEQLLTQNPLAGAGYLRLVYDTKRHKPVPIFVPIDEVALPYSATNFYTAERVTYIENITAEEFQSRIDSGMYRAVPSFEGITPAAAPPELNPAQKATDKIEGKEGSPYNEDGLRTIYESSVSVELKRGDDPEGETEGFVPYRISIDLSTRKVLAIVRNWDEDDPIKEPMHWMVEFPFIPWRGAYAIGLNQMMAGLPAAITGALRALLDSAHINNLPTLMRLKGANFSGQSTELNVASVTEIEGGIPGMDSDIRKLVMAVPYNPPSQALFQLLGFLVDAAKGVVRTSFDNIGDLRPDMPVGTMLTMVEQGMKVMSSIHLRMYDAMDNVLAILHRINRMYLVEEEVRAAGAPPITRADFDGPLDAIPVADPQIFSDAQRFAQLQMVMQRATGNPLYNQRRVEELFLERTKIPNALDLLIPDPQPQEMNAVNGVAAMVMGRPVVAFPEQDQLAHLQVLLDFMTSPVLGQLPVIAPTFLPAALNMIKERITFWYVNQFYELMSQQLQGVSFDEILKDKDPATRREVDQTLAAASPEVKQKAQGMFQSIPEIIQQAQALLQQYAPPMPQDPQTQAAVQIAQMSEATRKERISLDREKIQAAIAKDQAKLGIDQTKLQKDAAEDEANRQADLRREAFRQESENQRTAATNRSREAINTQDNQTALTIAAAEIDSGERIGLSTGTGINPTAT